VLGSSTRSPYLVHPVPSFDSFLVSINSHQTWLKQKKKSVSSALTVFLYLDNLIVGWGISPADGNPKGDAIKNAKTPVMDTFEKTYPFCELEAHGNAVGLPDGLMGNSEGKTPNSTLTKVGHLNIGAGRVVWQVQSLYNTLTSGPRAH
jgi:hypothetical protein